MKVTLTLNVEQVADDGEMPFTSLGEDALKALLVDMANKVDWGCAFSEARSEHVSNDSNVYVDVKSALID